MELSMLLHALLADPGATAKSALVALHLVGLVLGLGAATLLDLVIIRFLVKNKVTADYYHVIEFSSRVVSVGLVILWISGIGFLIHYGLFAPEKLGNQKIWAKIAIVGILTLNGVFIHRVVLPLVRERIGRGMFDGLPLGRRSIMLAAGSVSATSWYVPLLLGALPQLNFLPAATILLAYALVLSVAIAIGQWLGRVVLPRFITVTLPRTEYEDLMGRLARRDALLLQCLATLRAHRLSVPGVAGPAGRWHDMPALSAVGAH